MGDFFAEVVGVSLTTFLIICAVLFFIIYTAWRHTFFLRHGIRGPMPLPVLGNVLDWKRKGVHVAMDEFVRKYGNCYGCYRLYTPIIVVADPDMIKKILIQHFDNFTNRDIMPIEHPIAKEALFFSRDEQWRKLRSAVSPSFTGRKLKMMSPLMKKTSNRLVENMTLACEGDTKGVFECKDLFGAYVMDTLSMCAFGLEVDSQRNRDEPFVSHVRRFFASINFLSPILILTVLIPGAKTLFRWLRISTIPDDVVEFFETITNKAVEMRKKCGTKKSVDFLQLMMDATENDDDDEDEDDNNDVETSTEIKSKGKKEPLTKSELLSQALNVFVAGYETSTTALCFLSYLLATNPDQQQRLIDEIDQVTPTADDVTYETLKQLTFLDCVINEALRIFPPVVLAFREIKETITIDGHLFPAGTAVNIPVWSMHHNPKYWPDPEKFDPDRFSKDRLPEHHPFAWLPFGAGPRFCSGMRFALVEMKTALVRILQEFRLEVAPETQIPPDVGKMGFLTPPHGITLRAVQRHK